LTYAELVGYSLADSSDGKIVGQIAFVDDATENTLFELSDGTLLPAAEELIVEIDAERRVISMIIPEGLI
jgi:16S rRNA processing protein RimM